MQPGNFPPPPPVNPVVTGLDRIHTDVTAGFGQMHADVGGVAAAVNNLEQTAYAGFGAVIGHANHHADQLDGVIDRLDDAAGARAADRVVDNVVAGQRHVDVMGALTGGFGNVVHAIAGLALLGGPPPPVVPPVAPVGPRPTHPSSYSPLAGGAGKGSILIGSTDVNAYIDHIAANTTDGSLPGRMTTDPHTGLRTPTDPIRRLSSTPRSTANLLLRTLPALGRNPNVVRMFSTNRTGQVSHLANLHNTAVHQVQHGDLNASLATARTAVETHVGGNRAALAGARALIWLAQRADRTIDMSRRITPAPGQLRHDYETGGATVPGDFDRLKVLAVTAAAHATGNTATQGPTSLWRPAAHHGGGGHHPTRRPVFPLIRVRRRTTN